MTTAAMLGQLAMPVTRLPVLLVLLLFWVLAALALLFLAIFARFAPMLAAMGALLVVGLFAPALIRYLLRLLEATAMQQPSPVFEAAMIYPGAALFWLMAINVMPLLQVGAWLYFLAAVSTLTGGVLAIYVDIGAETDLPPTGRGCWPPLNGSETVT